MEKLDNMPNAHQLIATYEELFNIRAEDRLIQNNVLNSHASTETVNTAYTKALSAIGMTNHEFISSDFIQYEAKQQAVKMCQTLKIPFPEALESKLQKTLAEMSNQDKTSLIENVEYDMLGYDLSIEDLPYEKELYNRCKKEKNIPPINSKYEAACSKAIKININNIDTPFIKNDHEI